MKLLVVVDMQNDFINGALGSAEAAAIVPAVSKKIYEYRKNGDMIVFTKDTHYDNYLETQEGKNLPIPHCIKGTHGWEITNKIQTLQDEVICKEGFAARFMIPPNVEEVELVGLCTDICVISNAMRLKFLNPETPISVDAACCAGTTPLAHEAALTVMESCQIHIKNK